MKRWEKRDVLVVYCDYCAEEIPNSTSFISVKNESEEEKHFHYYNGEKCLDKYVSKNKKTNIKI